MDNTLKSEYDEEEEDELDDEMQLDSSSGPNLIFLPFQAFKEYPSLLQGKRVFKEDEPVHVRITNIERTTHPIFHPHIYEIEIQHAGYYWTIRRRYAKIHNLHRRLKLHSLTMRIARKTNLDHLTSNLKPRVPNIPRRMDVFVTPEQLESRRLKVEQFFSELLNVPLWREHPETLRFLEVSELSFLGELGEKGKEMPLEKLSGRVTIPLCCSSNNTFCDALSRWKERWILVKDTYYAYMSSSSKRIGNVLLIDQDLRIEHDARYSIRHKSLIVRNSSRDLVLKFGTQRDLDDWLKYFNYVLSTSGAQFIHAHPHGSSYPLRDDIPAKWFIDGAPYMSALADALEKAQEDIFITDWWLSPEIYMKRPITQGERWRLDRILQRRAEAGVKIYVLLYREVSLALTINSYHSKAILTSRHPNIKVQRHPEHIGANVWLWSHHEKTVIIDQKIGFLGGIDLCFGRWDDHLYRLADVGPLDQENPWSQSDEQKAPLEGGYGLVRAHPDSITAAELLYGGAKEDAAPEEVELRRGDRWRDARAKEEISDGKWRLGQRFPSIKASDEPDGRVTLHRSTSTKNALAKGAKEGPALSRLSAVVEAARRKDKSSLKESFSRRSVSAPSGSSHKIVRNEQELQAVEEEEEVAYGRDRIRLSKDQVKELHEGDSPKFRRSTKLLQNALRLAKRSTIKEESDGVLMSTERRVSENEQPQTDADLDKMNITKSGRLWIGKDYCNEIRQGFVKGAVERPDEDQLDRHAVPRMPWHDAGAVVYEEAARDLARHFIQRWNACKVERNRRDDNYSYLIPRSYDTCAVDRRTLEGTHNCRVQILRSVCTWSAGLQPGKVEDSIHQAYIASIQAARHFIYIEVAKTLSASLLCTELVPLGPFFSLSVESVLHHVGRRQTLRSVQRNWRSAFSAHKESLPRRTKVSGMELVLYNIRLY
ncbi:hypothetical protein RvY_06398-2 [Ramazzottius varieornatus]|uniref:phospholipase D n=1 Tax=Ramazzottius varieornatus TaxID=947166 RepID=A0A1D1UYG5_RAMVA|nr:hypothetical protein RvY_06398-2 [Ramazzottius varieornatus]